MSTVDRLRHLQQTATPTAKPLAMGVSSGGPEGIRTLGLCDANYVLALSTRVRTRLISYPSWALSCFRVSLCVHAFMPFSGPLSTE
jgi:hypothetical protein